MSTTLHPRLTVALVILLAACSGPGSATEDTPTTTTADTATTTTTATADPVADASSPVTTTDPPEAVLPTARILFSVNVQDFAYPDESARVLTRLVDLHERTGVPVDIYLTDDMARIFAADYPELLDRLSSSPMVAVSYHVRPPRPYGGSLDWLGLDDMAPEELSSTILRYETHAVDPTTGETTAEPGGYQLVADLVGYPPLAAAAAPPDPGVVSATRDVFADLGAVFTVVHGRSPELGDTTDGLMIRPEQAEVRIWEHAGEDAEQLLDPKVRQAVDQGSDNPPFVGVKIHDNDFFATSSAWVTVYVQDRRRPPWDPGLRAPLLSTRERDAMWATYEATVRRVADRDDLEALNLGELATGTS